MAQAARIETPHSQREAQQQTDLPVGEILRRTRVHYQKSIKDVETALRIRAEQIEAIEQGNVEKLPARVYAIGFVRSYAEFLGLDGGRIVDLFKTQSAGQASVPSLNFPVAATDSKAAPFLLVVVCVVVLIAFAVVFVTQQESKREVIESVPPPPKVVEQEIAVEQPVYGPMRPSLAEGGVSAEQSTEQGLEPADPVKPKGVVLNVQQNSWVEIRDKDDEVVLSRVLQAGDQYFVPDRPDLNISIGNAGGVSLEIDGVSLKPLGEKGSVIRRLPLDIDVLKTRFAVTLLENPVQ